MPEKAICRRLVEKGQALFDGHREPITFTREPSADALVSNIESYPHAFVLACIMDRQIKAERAWLIPYRVSQRIGGFTIGRLIELSLDDVKRIMREPAPLHWLVEKMPKYFHSAVHRIKNVYRGDAALIWKDSPSSAELVYRFLGFEGVGPKISSMAANILVRDFKVPLSDYYSIDVSADTHVRRVFPRLGLCSLDPTAEQVIYKARALHPEFPGMMDLPCWEIGRNWCKPENPKCGDCYMNDLCATALQGADG